MVANDTKTIRMVTMARAFGQFAKGCNELIRTSTMPGEPDVYRLMHECLTLVHSSLRAQATKELDNWQRHMSMELDKNDDELSGDKWAEAIVSMQARRDDFETAKKRLNEA